MTELVRYEAARAALAELQTVDEVKDFRDKAEAMAMYARQAKDREMLAWVTTIKVRAERRCGEMLAQVVKVGGDRRSKSRSHDTSLNALGITADESSRYQRLASIPPDVFEQGIERAARDKGMVTTSGLLKLAPVKRTQRPTKPATSDAARQRREQHRLEKETAEARARGISTSLSPYLRLALKALREVTPPLLEDEVRLLDELAEEYQRITERTT